jgi:hypothetical protein
VIASPEPSTGSASYDLVPVSKEWPDWGMKSGSRREGWATLVGSESGHLLLLIRPCRLLGQVLTLLGVPGMRCAGGGASAIFIAISVMPNMPRLSSATEPIARVSRTLSRKFGKSIE